jgi:hypothetical protein
MTKIIGYTDTVTECDCCGKTELKGTYCLLINEVELYYGSVCAFKNHGINPDEQKDLKLTFTKAQKNSKLIELHITPLQKKLEEKLKDTFSSDNLSSFERKIYNSIELDYKRVIDAKIKKYKINL